MLATESFKPTAVMASVICTVQHCIPKEGFVGKWTVQFKNRS